MTDAVAIAAVRRQVRELVDGTLEVKLHVEPRFKALFHKLLPEVDMPVALAPLRLDSGHQPAAAQPSTAEYASVHSHEGVGQGEVAPAAARSLAEQMMRSGYFRSSRLWQSVEAAGIYSQRDHKKWIEAQPCHGIKNLDGHRCEGDVVAHHTPGAELPAAGRHSDNPRKPPHWHCIPACHVFHTWVHSSTGALRSDKKMLVEHGVQYTAAQMKVMVKKHIGIASLRDLTIARLNEFEAVIGLPMTKWGDTWGTSTTT